MRLLFALAALPLLAGPAMGAPAHPATYLLTMHFDDGERLSGDPRLQVRISEPSTVMVGGTGRNSFTMQLTAAPRNDGTLSVTSTIDVVSLTGTRRHFSPALLVLPGHQATVELGEQREGARPIRVTFTYSPVLPS